MTNKASYVLGSLPYLYFNEWIVHYRNMPNWAQQIAVQSIRYFVEIIRMVMLKDFFRYFDSFFL
jgi:hypothetical protein